MGAGWSSSMENRQMNSVYRDSYKNPFSYQQQRPYPQAKESAFGYTNKWVPPHNEQKKAKFEHKITQFHPDIKKKGPIKGAYEAKYKDKYNAKTDKKGHVYLYTERHYGWNISYW